MRLDFFKQIDTAFFSVTTWQVPKRKDKEIKWCVDSFEIGEDQNLVGNFE